MKKSIKRTIVVAFLLVFVSAVSSFADSGGENVAEYGALSLLPPILTIVLAFATKQTIISMFAGIWLGATIMAGWNPLDGLIQGFTNFIIPQIADGWNAGMLVIMALIGGFMYMLSACGGAEAFGRWAQKTASSPKHAQLMAWIAPFIFIFNQGCLLVGVIMRPVTDKMRVSRVKLAYITDTMGAPLVSMSAISDNGVYLVGLIAAEIAALGLAADAYDLYFGMFQFNLYGIFSIITTLLIILLGLDIGSMYEAEKRARETGMTYGENDNLIAQPPESNIPEDYNLTMKNFLIPMITLIVTIFFCVFYTGKVWENGFIGSFGNANIQISIAMCFLAGSIAAGVVAVSTKLLTLGQVFDRWSKGAESMMQVILIIVLAWSISSVTKTMQIGPFMTNLVSGNIAPQLIPAIMFILGVIISFATGSSWGVWALGMPIAIPMAHALGLSIPLAIGAVVSGGLFGDHCSPISDTTIQSSTSACCDHLQHVKTQLPYAIIVGTASLIGFLIAGYVSNLLALPAALACILVALYFLKKRSVKEVVKTAK